MDESALKRILEAALLAAGRPLSLADMERLFAGDAHAPPRDAIRAALAGLADDWAERSLTLLEVASGFRAQVRTEFEPWIARLWDEKPPRLSRALLETLAIIAYRQPITRSEIEEIRGVAVSTQIVRSLTERGWIRVVGHREAPGKPAMYGTTRGFLDHFNLKTLDQLPAVTQIREMDGRNPELALEGEPQVGETASNAEAAVSAEGAASGAEPGESERADEASGADDELPE
jgi:segregation and condensation protein B